MEVLEKIFSKDSEIHDIFEQFKLIENIYENSLLAMGYKSYNSNISSNTNYFSLPNLKINSSKDGY
jgi:hypothetical protein